MELIEFGGRTGGCFHPRSHRQKPSRESLIILTHVECQQINAARTACCKFGDSQNWDMAAAPTSGEGGQQSSGRILIPNSAKYLSMECNKCDGYKLGS